MARLLASVENGALLTAGSTGSAARFVLRGAGGALQTQRWLLLRHPLSDPLGRQG